MLLLFKLLGLVLIFLTSMGIGFLNSSALRRRKERLCSIYRSFVQLAEYIKSENTEITALLERCFEQSDIILQNGKVQFNEKYLESEDNSLLKEFLNGFGTRDIEGEYKRTCMYASLLDKQRELADGKCKELCRLYDTLGVLLGAVICIFFI